MSEIMSAMPASERRKHEVSIRELHDNCGHPPNHVLVRMLLWKAAKENALAARLLPCRACEKAKPPGVKKPVSASHEHREPWRVVGCDLAEWKHPVYLKREKCTCGYESMKPRNLQSDTSGPKVRKLETLMVAVCWTCCRNARYQFWDVCTHCEQILKKRGATRKCTKG